MSTGGSYQRVRSPVREDRAGQPPQFPNAGEPHSCCGSCCRCLGCVWRGIAAFFFPEISEVTVLKDYIGLVRGAQLVTLGGVLLAGIVNAAAILYVIKMLETSFEGRLPNISQVVSYEQLMFQFEISLGILLVGPIAFFTMIFWPLFRACRYSGTIRVVEDRFVITVPKSKHRTKPAPASAPQGSETSLRSINDGPGGGSAPLVAAVVAEDQEVVQYERYDIGATRKFFFCIALFGAFCLVILCSISLGGVLNWGGSGVIFLLRVRDDTATLFRAARMDDGSHGSLQTLTLTICGFGIAACAIWLILVVATIAAVVIPIFAEFRRQHARFLLVVPLFLASGFLAFLIYEMIQIGTPPQLGRRLCFVNSCSDMIRVGQVGAATGIPCSQGCPRGTVCNPGNSLCHFQLKFGHIFLGAHGGSQCVEFDFPPVMANIYPDNGGVVHTLTQWSGSIYASSQCDPGSGNCLTAICPGCQVFNGPVGPVTQAEMTILVNDRDYYDVTIINGANLPMKITPIIEGGTVIRPDPSTPPEYYCASPGAMSDTTGVPASWTFAISSSLDQQLHALVAGGSGAACQTSSDCPGGGGEICGTAMSLNSEGKPLSTVVSGTCGQLVGIWSDDELCAWTDGSTFGNCKTPVPGGVGGATYQQMFACDGPYSVSCFQNTATSDCCGCSTWPQLQLQPTMTCAASNAAWEQYAQPGLLLLKQGCPSCYTYPFDDSTSLFTCWSNATVNDLSYTIEWCPGGDGVRLQ